jgi:hypothetical protein
MGEMMGEMMILGTTPALLETEAKSFLIRQTLPTLINNQ